MRARLAALKLRAKATWARKWPFVAGYLIGGLVGQTMRVDWLPNGLLHIWIGL